MVASYLRQGMAAGLLAGLLARLFAFFLGEPYVDRAVALEAAADSHHEEEVFSRATQKGGLQDPGEFPSGLLWDFRLSSLGTQIVFWSGLGVVFGLLCERTNRREPLGN